MKSLKPVLERWARLIRREMPEEILISTGVPLPLEAQAELASHDSAWQDRDCLCVSDPDWVVRQCHLAAANVNAVEDDALPLAYPHLHFGESLYSALVGGRVRYIGTANHTCSGAEPVLASWDRLDRLRLEDSNPVLAQVLDILRYAADRSEGQFLLQYFIFIDALNLAVELRGTTQAYLDLHSDPAQLRRLFEFGIELNEWFFRHQERIIRPHNESLLKECAGNLGVLQALLAWDSVDAYTLCNPQVYRDCGMQYQSRLLRRVGGGTMHTHGTALLELLPLVARLDGLSCTQAGNDLHGGEVFDVLPQLPRLRAAAGTVPLVKLRLKAEEFEQGIRRRLLIGNAHYVVPCEDADQARRCVDTARQYRAPC